MILKGKRKWKIMIFYIISLFLISEASALEISNNYSASIVSQIAAYILEQIMISVKHKEKNTIDEIANNIAKDTNRDAIKIRLENIKSYVLSLENNSVDNFKLSIVEPPIIISTNIDLETTVLVFFTVNGKTLRVVP